MRSPGHPPLAHAGAFALGIALVGAPAVLARLLAAHAGAAFTVLILTAAALGPGAAAAQVMLRAAGRPRRDDPDGNVAAYALAAALLLPLAWLMATRVRFDPQHLGDDLLQIASLLLVEVVLAAPFFCAGLAAGTALHAYRSRMAGLCAALLFGAACGAFAAPFGVQALGGPAALCALGVVLLLCAACFYASQAVGRVSVWCGGRAIAALAFALLGAAYAVPLARRAGFDVPGAFGREGPAPEAGALSLAADAAGALDPVVLWAALVQAALVGILCVVHPVRRIEVGLADRGTRAVLVAFAAAGLACSALAIGLGERLAGFLGQREHAANAANTVLPGMLAAAACGALFECTRNPGRRPLLVVAVVAPVLALVSWWAANHGIAHFAPAEPAARVALALGTAAPAAFAAGMAFPAALRFVDRRRPELVPWALAVSAFAVVLAVPAALLCVKAAGATWVTLAAVVLLAAGLGALGMLRGDGDAPGGGDVFEVEEMAPDPPELVLTP